MVQTTLSEVEPLDGSLERIRRCDRQATLERLMAYVAHSLGSPLNVIEGRAAMMASGRLGEAEVKRNAAIIVEQSARIVRFLREALTSTRGESQRETKERVRTDLSAVARTAVALLGPAASAHGASIAIEADVATAEVRGNPESLLIALTHVLDNAIRATPEGGTLTVRLRQESGPEERFDPGGPLVPFFCVDIDDDGGGIQPDVLPHLFKPFTTTRDDRHAIGLGLFIAQSIAKEHGGWLEGVNRTDKGARFTLHVPQGPAHAE